jgi:hypothetical protein
MAQVVSLAVEATPNGLVAVKVIDNIRKNGVQGDIATFLPEANLTSSDASLLEKTTGTTTLAAAVASSTDALSLTLNISGNRQDGSLVGDVSRGYLQNLLAYSNQLDAAGESDHLASPAFLEQAITNLQSPPTQQLSASTVNTTV